MISNWEKSIEFAVEKEMITLERSSKLTRTNI